MKNHIIKSLNEVTLLLNGVAILQLVKDAKPATKVEPEI